MNADRPSRDTIIRAIQSMAADDREAIVRGCLKRFSAYKRLQLYRDCDPELFRTEDENKEDNKE